MRQPECAAVAPKGQNLPVADGLIAACATVHSLCLVTRNMDDYIHTGISLNNPWSIVNG